MDGYGRASSEEVRSGGVLVAGWAGGVQLGWLAVGVVDAGDHDGDGEAMSEGAEPTTDREMKRSGRALYGL
jgi:hypothetical protein